MPEWTNQELSNDYLFGYGYMARLIKARIRREGWAKSKGYFKRYIKTYRNAWGYEDSANGSIDALLDSMGC